MLTSARNHFVGQIAEIKTSTVSDEITLRTPGAPDIVAIITRGSATSLGLARGTDAFALVNASSVILLVDFDSSKCRRENCVA